MEPWCIRIVLNGSRTTVIPDSKVYEAYMGPTWGQQDPGGPHVGPMNLAIRDLSGISSPLPSASYMRQGTGSTLVQVMACRLFGAKPLPEPMLLYCQSYPKEHISVKF